MAVSTSTNWRRDPYRYRELERGVGIWYAGATLTGDGTGGEAKIEVYTNPGSASNFQPFVAVTRITTRKTVAAESGGWYASPALNSWERGNEEVFQPLIADGTYTRGLSATNFKSSWFGFVNLGRVLKGTPGEIEFESENVNTQVTNLWIEGLWAEHPIASRWWTGA